MICGKLESPFVEGESHYPATLHCPARNLGPEEGYLWTPWTSRVAITTYSEDGPYGELLDLRYANPRLAIRTMEQNRDVILGVKVWLSRSIAGENDLQALKLAKEAASVVDLPVMVHINDTHSSPATCTSST